MENLHSIRLHFLELSPEKRNDFIRCLKEPEFRREKVGESICKPRENPTFILPYDFIILVLCDLLHCVEPNIFFILRNDKFLFLEFSTILHGSLPSVDSRSDGADVINKLFMKVEVEVKGE